MEKIINDKVMSLLSFKEIEALAFAELSRWPQADKVALAGEKLAELRSLRERSRFSWLKFWRKKR